VVDRLLTEIDFVVNFHHRGDPANVKYLELKLQLLHKSRYDPHKVAHLHPGGIVSYAILRPPSQKAACHSHEASFKAPIMVQLHGAGLEADNPLVAHALDPLPDLCGWVLFPTGVTPWSADDWHTWGFADVQAAIANIRSWIIATKWRGVGVDIEKWFVAGHSNGGQGTWYMMLHYPDRVFAASPVSGYLSIPQYVPYTFWRPAEPKKRAIVEAVSSSYRHELLVPNARGIPIQQQHGEKDDNVPAYHSRLMSQLLTENRWSSNYSEVDGQGHWWDGVITTDVLSAFYQEQFGKAHEVHDVPGEFEVVVANPADMGSKFGLKVLYLAEPGEFGKIVAARNNTTKGWLLQLHNIMAFEWEKDMLGSSVMIDGVEVRIEKEVIGNETKTTLWRDKKGSWSTKVSNETPGKKLEMIRC
jgi:predicted esterase